jgi:Fungal chitosanase of glycosyl hydrolase group 75
VKALRTFVLICGALIFTAIIYRWISLERLQGLAAPPEPTVTPAPEPTATKPPPMPNKVDIVKLFNGINLHASVDAPPGADAATERSDPRSYIVELQLKTKTPAPNQTIEELAKVSPDLPNLLPGLSAMLKPEAVSSLFADLYANKVRILRDKLSHLEELLSRHNFYDCQTILQLQEPQTHRKAFLLQADMDVDADGSDGDRLPSGSGVSTNFKPFTSYRWPKKSSLLNPYLDFEEQRLKRYEDESAQKTVTPERKRDLMAGIKQVRDEIGALKKFSYLIGATDPYIVVPGVFTHAKDGPRVGDYAVVIFGKEIYPAIVGDVGPNDKVGEASLRIAKEVNNLATAYNRPVSELKVTYLIFPGSADNPFGPPDFDKMQARCQSLIDEIGGATVPLHRWENIIPPLPTPTPSPTSPPPTASPSGSPGASASASPSATFAFPVASPSASPSP